METPTLIKSHLMSHMHNPKHHGPKFVYCTHLDSAAFADAAFNDREYGRAESMKKHKGCCPYNIS